MDGGGRAPTPSPPARLGQSDAFCRLNATGGRQPHDASDFLNDADGGTAATGGVNLSSRRPGGIGPLRQPAPACRCSPAGTHPSAQRTGGGGGTNPPAPPPPPTGGGAPYPTGVAPTYAEEFNSGWGSWSHNWQSEEGIQQTGNGTIRIGGSSNPGSGLMYQNPNSPAAGFGDGLYEFRARMEGPGLGNGSGPALVLWPGDDRWPGPEIDIGEIGGGGDLYMATHWNNNGQDAYNIYSAPGVDWRQWHNYAARLENNRITYYVDGQQIGVETQHPAPEYGEGGVNHVPSVMNRSSETMIEVDYFRFTDESALV